MFRNKINYRGFKLPAVNIRQAFLASASGLSRKTAQRNSIKYYLKIWLLYSRNSFLSVFYSKLSLAIFLTGKLIRFGFFLYFLFLLLEGTNTVAGYGLNEMLFFFLTFNLIDILGQFLFRETYRFRPLIVSGDFDLVLTKPFNPLFRALMGGSDPIDAFTLPPLILMLIIIGSRLDPNFWLVASYIILVLNGLIISAAFHIFVLALGIITFEIDHLILIYRDMASLGRLPVDIYRQPLRSIITYFLPIGIMMTLPVKALLGKAALPVVSLSLLLGMLFLLLSLIFWKTALKKYTSASS